MKPINHIHAFLKEIHNEEEWNNADKYDWLIIPILAIALIVFVILLPLIIGTILVVISTFVQNISFTSADVVGLAGMFMMWLAVLTTDNK